MLKSFKHCKILRFSPLEVEFISSTICTFAPSKVRRLAIISPISPLPKITTSLPTILPSMLTIFCAVPAVKIPIGRVPLREMLPAVFSLHPTLKTHALNFTSFTPFLQSMVAVFSPNFVTKVLVRTVMFFSLSTIFRKRCANSGPVSSSPK